MTPVLIRPASWPDATELATLRWLSREPHEQDAEPLGAFAPRFVRWFLGALESGRWFVAVASSGEGLLGCLYLQHVATVPVPGIASHRWGYVTHAFVREEHRNRGLGSRMLALVIQQAQRSDLHELQVWPSGAAVTLYTRAGFLSPEQLRSASPPDEASYVLPLASVPDSSV